MTLHTEDVIRKMGYSKKGSPQTALLALLFSCFLVWGYFFAAYESIPWNSWTMYVAIILLFLVIYMLIEHLWRLLDAYLLGQKGKEECNPPSRRFCVASTGVLMISWCFTLLGSWPGFYCYDTDHITNYFETGFLKNSQPVIHTLLTGNVIRIGQTLFGTFNSGVVLFILFQIGIGVIVVLAVMHYLSRCGAPSWLLVLAVVFYSLNPAVSMLMCCSTKDSLFSLWLTLLGIVLYACVDGNEVRRNDFIMLTALTFLTLAWRSNMLIALVIVFVVMAFSLKHNKKLLMRLLIPLILGTGVFAFWSGPACASLGVVSSNPIREAISIPSVEIARCQGIDGTIDDDLISLGVDPAEFSAYYDESHQFTDRLRAVFYDAIGQGKYGELFSLWMKVRSRYPLECVSADLELTRAAWCPWALMNGYNEAYSKSMSAYDYDVTETCSFAAVCESPAEQHSKLPFLADFYWKISRYDDPATIGPLFILMSVAPYLWLLLITLARCSIVGNRAGRVFCWVLLSVVLTVLLGPMVLLRYYFYLILSAPVLVWLLISKCDNGATVRRLGSDEL